MDAITATESLTASHLSINQQAKQISLITMPETAVSGDVICMFPRPPQKNSRFFKAPIKTQKCDKISIKLEINKKIDLNAVSERQITKT